MMKVARAIRPKKKQFISSEELQSMLSKLQIAQLGMTKSGELLVSYKGYEFTIPRQEKEGFKRDACIDKIAHELTKVDLSYEPGTKLDEVKEQEFMYAYEELRKKLRGLKL